MWLKRNNKIKIDILRVFTDHISFLNLEESLRVGNHVFLKCDRHMKDRTWLTFVLYVSLNFCGILLKYQRCSVSGVNPWWYILQRPRVFLNSVTGTETPSSFDHSILYVLFLCYSTLLSFRLLWGLPSFVTFLPLSIFLFVQNLYFWIGWSSLLR